MQKILVALLLIAAPSLAADADRNELTTKESMASSQAIQAPDITLPEDKKLWNKMVMDYLSPVLIGAIAKSNLQTLLDFTMPTHGDFDPLNVERRTTTLKLTHQKLTGMEEEAQIQYISDLHIRHVGYLTNPSS